MPIVFSLILPVYNVESYIARCLESCCNQVGVSPDDYEIIVVDDGTPDKSMSVVQQVKEAHPNHHWKIITRENGGLSAARNSGIEVAEGHYLWFIDSDDYIVPNALARLTPIVEKGEFDIINFTHKTICKNDRIIGGNRSFSDYEIYGANYLMHNDFLSACACLYSKKLIEANALSFKEGVIWEDSEFNVRAYLKASRCYCIPDALYCYVRRDNSISDGGATPYSTHSRISNAYGLDTYVHNGWFSHYEQKVAYAKIASMLIFAIAGIPELQTRARKHYREEIARFSSAYFRILWKCHDVKQQMVLLVYMILPVFVEQMLNRKLKAAIKRSIS